MKGLLQEVTIQDHRIGNLRKLKSYKSTEKNCNIDIIEIDISENARIPRAKSVYIYLENYDKNAKIWKIKRYKSQKLYQMQTLK